MSQPLPAEADPDPVERDRQWQLVRSRWNQSYLESLARRNRASWITFNELPGRAPDVKRRGERVFRVSHRFLERMGAITPAAFGSTYSLLNRQQEDFRRTATAGNLRTLVYAAMASLEVSNRNHVIWGSFARILLAAAAIGVALPTFSTGGIGLEATWVAFGGAALATTPWSEILRLLQLLPTSGRTRLVMFGNE